MDKLSIITAQNVNIEYNIASIGDRMVAKLIDYGISIGFLLFMYFIVYNLHISDDWMLMGLSALGFVVIVFYPFVMEVATGGQTIGKMIRKIKVVKINGNRATLYEYFIRWVLSIVEIWIANGIVGLISMLSTKKSQRLGDLAADTTVISLRSTVDINRTVYEQIVDTYVITYPQVQQISDKDINLIKKSYVQAINSKNDFIIEKLALKVAQVIDIPVPTKDLYKFVDTVIKDHYHLFKDN